MKVEYHPATVSDVNEAVAFYNSKVSGLGDEFRDKVYQAIERIRMYPK